VWARNLTTRVSLSQTRRMPCWARPATSGMVSPVNWASSAPLRLAHHPVAQDRRAPTHRRGTAHRRNQRDADSSKKRIQADSARALF
jgi:hypothetical protein